MKLALHRSLTFWSGVLAAVFLLWAWQDSVHAQSVAHCRGFVMSNVGCGVSLAYKQDQGNEPGYFYREYLIDDWRSLQEWRLAPPKFYRIPVNHSARPLLGEASEDLSSATSLIFMPITSLGATGDWLLFVPHWLILMVVAMPWLGLLFWRSRRRAAVAKPQ